MFMVIVLPLVCNMQIPAGLLQMVKPIRPFIRALGSQLIFMECLAHSEIWGSFFNLY